MTNTRPYADLEIRILERQDAGYPVEITLNADWQYPRGFLSAELPAGDGATLFAWLFADAELREAWEHARGQHPQRRIRLRIDATAPELHALTWESLRDPATGLDLAATDATPFSRYLAGTWHPSAPLLTRPLKLLVAIAAPESLADYGLAPLDAEAEWAALCEATASQEVTLTRIPAPCTLAALEAELRRGYHALHIIAHGVYRKGKDAALFLADRDNRVAPVTDADFAAMLKRQLADSDPDGTERLRLVFLASCQSATRDSADAFRGLAPRLVEAGVPAIVAMQGAVSLTAARKFSRVFYRQLAMHGRVDLAGNQARAALLTAGSTEAATPVLFMRLPDGKLWAPIARVTDALNLNDQWVENHLREVIKAAEPRYTPKLKVHVPIAMAFEALGRTPSWIQAVSQLVEEIAEVSKQWTESYTKPGLGPEDVDFPPAAMESARLLDDQLHRVEAVLKEFLICQLDTGLTAQLADVVNYALELASKCLSASIKELEAKYGKGKADSVSFRQFMAEYQVSFPARHVDTTRDVITVLKKLRDWVNQPEAHLPMSPAMLLLGPAGIGKTHAICDIALTRHEQGLRSVVLLGERFTYVTGEPWERIRSLIGLGTDTSQDELYRILDAAGEATGYPLILFIDALNETTPREFWYDSLLTLIEQIRDYDWIKLCVSCRSTYYEDVVAQNVQIYEVEHKGFAGVEFDACFEFFSYYELEAPSMPLMQPEFSNPLFLRLVCESLHDAGVKQLPEGMVGISQIIHYLLENKNKKLARLLDYNPREQRVQEALECILSGMQENQATWLAWRQGKKLVDSIWPSLQRSSSLFDHLLREGLIREDKIITPSGESLDAILISFERLAEYLLVERYLSKIPIKDLHNAFAPRGVFDFVISDAQAVSRNRGLLEALAIQIPEKYRLELSQVVDGRIPNSTLAHIITESLIWRADDSVNLETGEIVKEALKCSESFDSAMDTLLALSTRVGNPLNALWFHSLLSSVTLPDRDSFLCQYLYEAYGQQRNLDRLIRWALKFDLGETSREVVELWATQLCWFCAASDRRVRDYATKALVRLTEDHSAIWSPIIERFSRIDDEYVVERCLAAAYGSLIRGNDHDAIMQVALTTYNTFFDRDFLPPNAMIRDYARLILELATHYNLLPEHIRAEQFRPPYESDWPLDWPDEDFVEQYSDSYWKLPKLYSSCLRDDFADYVVLGALHDYEDIEISQALKWIFKQVLDMGYTTERFADFDGYILSKYGPGRSKPFWIERVGKKYQWIALYRLMARIADHCEKNTNDWSPSVPELQALGQRKIDPTILLHKTQQSDITRWWVPVDYDFISVDTLSDDDWLSTEDFPDSTSMLQVKDTENGRNWIVLQAYLHWRSNSSDSKDRYPYRMIWMQLRSYLVQRKDQLICWDWLKHQDFMGRWMPEGLDIEDGFLGEYPWGVPFIHFFDRVAFERSDVEEMNARLPCRMLPTVNTFRSGSEYDAYQENSIVMMAPTQEFFIRSKLHWNTMGGYLSDSGKLCFNYPAMSQSGPSALLVDKEYLFSFLEENELVLMWTTLAEKQCVYGLTPSHDELGYAKHSKVHMLVDGNIRSTSGITNHIKP